jgi:hypothetical protein
VGTFGEALGTVGAWRADAVNVDRLGVLALGEVISASDELAVPGREVVALNDGRRRDVRDGDGGRGVGGLL